MSEPANSPNLEELTPEEANRIIHSHRKVRYGTPAPGSRDHLCGRRVKSMPVPP